tara:strand:- start:1152 stop:1646 length:495 start_codon:yes stop_codon:yes gene_type:complete
MEIRNRSTGAVITISQFKSDNQSTSFPKQITADILDSYGYDIVLNGPAATVTAPYGVSVRDGVEEVDGQWFTRFVAGPVFTDTTDGDGNVTTAAENEAAYRARVDADAAERVRTERNKKLADSDWTQLADSGADAAAWATYRQSLRDLPSSDGFPHDVTWPTAP